MKKAALNLLVRQANLDEKSVISAERAELLKRQFEAIDTAGNGMIQASELANALKKLELRFDDAQINSIIAEMDYYGNGMLNYSEFLAAALSVDQVLNDEQLWNLFKKFDVDGTDFITTENLKEAFSRLGRTHVMQAELEQIMSIHDINHNGTISFEEFKLIFGDFES